MVFKQIINWRFGRTADKKNKTLSMHLPDKPEEENDLPSFDPDGNLSAGYRSAIRSILLDFMQKINVTYPTVTYDETFAQGCAKLAIERGCPVDIVKSDRFQTALHVGASIAITTYAHLENLSTRQFVCLYTTCLVVFDDRLSQTDASALREFHSRFAGGRPQDHPVLDLFAGIVKSSYDHFLPTCANLVISNSLNCITGFILDHDLQEMKMNEKAIGYPRWIRNVMGNSPSFAVFGFPPEVPLTSFVQILPIIINYVDDVNDLFSFYKEESAHEDTTHVSLLAQMSGKSKIQCMKDLAVDCANASRRCEAVLSTDPKALKIFRDHFSPGYIGFHALAHKRYRLDDLDLGNVSST